MFALSTLFWIDELFRDVGIVIAYPRRDTYLDLLKPMEIKLVSSLTNRDDGMQGGRKS